jgi:PAS domain S-box-containing protein
MVRSQNPGVNNRSLECAPGITQLFAEIADAKDHVETAWLAADAIPGLFPCDVSGVVLRSGANGHYEPAILAGGKRLSRRRENITRADLDLLFKAVGDLDLLAIPDPRRKGRPQTVPAGFRKLNIGVLAVAPLRTRGRLTGILLAGRKHAGEFSSEEVVALQIIAGPLALAADNGDLRKNMAVAESRLADLQDMEQRYQFLYTNAPAMLHSIDSDGRLVSVSDFWLSVLGYERHEVIGRKSVDFVDEESRKRAVEEYLPILYRDGIILDCEYTFVKKNGDTVDVLFSTIMERDAAGKFTRSLAVLIDVTERNRAFARVRQLQRELNHVSRLSAMGPRTQPALDRADELCARRPAYP